MEYLNSTDLLFLKASAACLIFAYGKSYITQWMRPKIGPSEFAFLTQKISNQQKKIAPSRKIKKQLAQTGKRCIIFYGSQTGTAEKLALRMAKDGSTRYDLQCLVADLDDFDYDDLNALEDHLAIFILATYGEGEPTDNAITFNSFLSFAESGSKHFSPMQLQYAAFGLGSSSYQNFNSMIRRTDSVLQSCGADRIGELGIGDDGKGTLEDDFDEWRKSTLAAIADRLHLSQLEYKFRPTFQVSESKVACSKDVFMGEPNKSHLRKKEIGPFTAQNPLRAEIVEVKELFNSPDRNCLHFEFDIGKSTLTYDTGDHLAVWPVNSDLEVELFLKTFGLWNRKDAVIDMKSLDPSIKVPIPSPTTYEAAARYYLDIGGPVSRQVLEIIASVIQDAALQSELHTLATDSTVFQQMVARKRLTISRLLCGMGAGIKLTTIPFSLLVENIPKLKPRHYSISSSSLCSSNKISITAVVDSISSRESGINFKGVNTNYLLALKNKFSPKLTATGEEESATQIVSSHQVDGPRAQYSVPTALIHVRRSKFRLPRKSSTPIIMIGPGTGVAPFRAFIQERALAAESGRQVGRTILFYGCRRRDEDFLYRDEWQKYQESLGEDTFSVNAAFSREGTRKVYVQDLVSEHASELKSLILDGNAHVYVCGDASQMAKGVFDSFASIIDGHCEGTGKEYLKIMKASGRWSEDVW